MEKLVKVERLVKSGEVNANGYLFDVDTLNKHLDEYVASGGKILLNEKTVDEMNDMMKKGEFSDSKFIHIGTVKKYDDEYIYFEPHSDSEDFSGKKVNICILGTVKREGEMYKVTVDAVQRLLLGKYE